LLLTGGLLGRLGSLLYSNFDSIVLLIPLHERVGIDKDNGSLDECLCTDQLVITGVIGNIQNTDLTCADLSSPGKVSGIETKGTLFFVSSTATDLMDTLFTDFGHGGGTSHFELALLAKPVATSSGLTTLVNAISANTLLRYTCYENEIIEEVMVSDKMN